MNLEIGKVTEWLRINKLSLNLKKTHFMLFKKSQTRCALDTDLVIEGIKIGRLDKKKN